MQTRFMSRLQSRQNQRGVTAIEYALLSALIALVIIGGVSLIGDKISETFNTIAAALTTKAQ